MHKVTDRDQNKRRRGRFSLDFQQFESGTLGMKLELYFGAKTAMEIEQQNRSFINTKIDG